MLLTSETYGFALVFLSLHTILIWFNMALWSKRTPNDLVPAVYCLRVAQWLSIFPFCAISVTLIILCSKHSWDEGLCILEMVCFLESLFIQATVSVEPILRMNPIPCMDLSLHFSMYVAFFGLACGGGMLHYVDEHSKGIILYTASLVGAIYASTWMVMDATLEVLMHSMRLVWLFMVVISLLCPAPFHVHMMVNFFLGLLAIGTKGRQLFDRRELPRCSKCFCRLV